MKAAKLIVAILAALLVATATVLALRFTATTSAVISYQATFDGEFGMGTTLARSSNVR